MDRCVSSVGCKNVTIEDVHVGGRGGHYTVCPGITVPSLYNYQLDRRLSRPGNADR